MMKTMMGGLLVVVVLGLTALACEPAAEEANEEEGQATSTSPLDGVWTLVELTLDDGQVAQASEWRGTLIVADGHFSRNYMRIKPSAADNTTTTPAFMTNSGTFVYNAPHLELQIQFSDYPPLRGMVFKNKAEFEADGARLIILTTDENSAFKEVWERR